MFVKQTGYIYSNKYRAEGKGEKRLKCTIAGNGYGVRRGWEKQRKTDRQPYN